MPKLSKEDVVAQLTKLGIEFDPKTPYNDLLKLLKENESQEERITLDKPADLPSETPKPEKLTLETEGLTTQEEKIVEEVKESVNPFTSFEDKRPLSKKAHEMRKKLMHQPRVPVMIPLGHEEKVGATHQVTLNGYTLFIRKGQMVDVPLQVKQVLDEMFDHDIHVRQHPMLVGSGDPRDIKLSKFD